MKDIVNGHVRDLYLNHLREPVHWKQGRSRANNPEMYTKIEPADSILFDEGTDTSNVWVWSDLHFWHKNIIGFSDRPYDSVEHMNSELGRNYRMCVKEDDICIWVGDVTFSNDNATNHFLQSFPGYKILVAGNHDFNKKKLRKLEFDEVHLTLALEFPDDVWLAFTHYPLEGKLPDKFLDNMGLEVYNIHGHTHDRNIDNPRFFNVSVENIMYTPSQLGEVVKVIEKEKRAVWSRATKEV